MKITIMSRKSLYDCKHIQQVEKKFKEVIIDYIHFLSVRKDIDLNQLYSLFFVSNKKPKKVNYSSLRDTLVNRLNFDFETLNVKINENNLYEHADTGFIIAQEKDRLVVIGKKTDNPRYIDPLNKEDIEKCKRYNLFYEIPDNLFTHVVVTNKSSKNKIESLYHKLKHGTTENEQDIDDDEEDEENEE